MIACRKWATASPWSRGWRPVMSENTSFPRLSRGAGHRCPRTAPHALSLSGGRLLPGRYGAVAIAAKARSGSGRRASDRGARAATRSSTRRADATSRRRRPGVADAESRRLSVPSDAAGSTTAARYRQRRATARPPAGPCGSPRRPPAIAPGRRRSSPGRTAGAGLPSQVRPEQSHRSVGTRSAGPGPCAAWRARRGRARRGSAAREGRGRAAPGSPGPGDSPPRIPGTSPAARPRPRTSARSMP
jgi:hypothetical protein